MTSLKPFQDEITSLMLDELTIENRLDRVAIYGSLQITKDQSGLAHARELKQILCDIVAALEETDLPEQISLRPTDSVENPFK